MVMTDTETTLTGHGVELEYEVVECECCEQKAPKSECELHHTGDVVKKQDFYNGKRVMFEEDAYYSYWVCPSCQKIEIIRPVYETVYFEPKAAFLISIFMIGLVIGLVIGFTI